MWVLIILGWPVAGGVGGLIGSVFGDVGHAVGACAGLIGYPIAVAMMNSGGGDYTGRNYGDR